MSPEPVMVAVRYQAIPGREATARGELIRLIETVVDREPSCRGITLYEDAGDGGRFLLYEEWDDRGVFVGEHMRTPHLTSFIERSRDFLAGPPEITFWRSIAERQRR